MKVPHVVVSALGVAGLVAGVPLGASAAPATATAGCTLSVSTRVAIGKPSVAVPQKLTGACGQPGGFAVWDLDYPDPRSQQYAFAGVSSSNWFFTDDLPIGQYVWRTQSAEDPSGNPLTQNTVTTTAKLAAGAWISSKRVGDVVTLNGTSLLYSVTTNKYFQRPAAGVFQFRERGTTTWKALKSVQTNSRGQVTMAYRYSKVRDYRFALYSTPISWDLGSAVTTR
jgi:hypothetical protein